MLATFVKRGRRRHSVGLFTAPAAVSATFNARQVGTASPAESASSTAAEAASQLPAGPNIAIGSRIRSNPRPWPGESASNAVDGDGTSRWCPSTGGTYQLEVDLGRIRDLSGFGLTFSGAGNPFCFSVYYSTKRPTATFGAPEAQSPATVSPMTRMSEYVVDAPIPSAVWPPATPTRAGCWSSCVLRRIPELSRPPRRRLGCHQRLWSSIRPDIPRRMVSLVNTDQGPADLQPSDR